MGAKAKLRGPWLWLVRGWGRKQKAAPAIGVLTFEVSRLMSKTINLWQSLDDDRIAVLRDETLSLQGVRKLVSDEDEFLLSLVLAETMDAVHLLGRAVARLGSRCFNPVLYRFEHVFADLIKNDTDLCCFEYRNKKRMEREVKRMERFIAASCNLYQEVEILAEMENDLRRMQAIPEMSRQGCSLGNFKKRVSWQRQAVKSLQDASVWNRSHDFVVRILARALFTIVARIKLVFGFDRKDDAYAAKTTGNLSNFYNSVSGILQSSFLHASNRKGIRSFASGPLVNHGNSKSSPLAGFHKQNNTARIDTDEIEDESEPQPNVFNMKLSLSLFGSKRKLLNAPPSTLGAASLALHYANVIIVIEKLAASPNSIGPDVRDELYRMLPSSIRTSLKTRLSSYAKNLASSVYDPTLAAEWSDAMINILNWLSPLAHNMIKWQSERNFEKQNLVLSTNVLLIQTLYYANQEKTEAAITELLVGLNYLWRYGRELNAKSVLDCVSRRALMAGERNRDL
ncbi:uncharacterized protein LOC110025423 [Phalaenopsis equestris]|uniref:uncharacterized protein LOC110025423 n=1 Tax=Phalaenopsis equestris TaxID=78828 RepID=UPI0009E1DF60|nr:uncharacterized protein LOC110025423 [Phalaenopsis equestris]